MPTSSTPSPDPAAGSCPRCHQPIPVGAAHGLCPACMLAAGFFTQAAPDAPASDAPPPGPADLAPEFPQLEIIELLGRGGMGAVYKARQRHLDRLVALKLLRPGLDADPSFAERFTREARALAQLNHPGIVTLHEFGRTAGGLYFIVMEFVDGMNLRQLLAAGRIAPREALAIVPPLCDALQYAHDRGLVHRDIKPENILIDRLGRVKIADFGLARLVAETEDEPSGRSPGENDPAITLAGQVMGTPRYMAPEQREHPSAVDHRADIYALGVVLYQMLTGELPDEKQLQPPSRRVLLDVRLDEIVLRALEKNPALRYAAATEFKTEVETFAASNPTPGKSPGAHPAPSAPPPWHPFARLWLTPLLLLLACIAISIAVTFSLPRTYRSTASIRANFKNADQRARLAEPENVMLSDRFMAKLTGPGLTLERLRKNLRVEPMDIQLTRISFDSGDRLEAATVANQVAQAYLKEAPPDSFRMLDAAVPSAETRFHSPNRPWHVFLGFFTGALLGTVYCWRRIRRTLRSPQRPSGLRPAVLGALLLPLLTLDVFLALLSFRLFAETVPEALAATSARHSALGLAFLQHGPFIASLAALLVCALTDLFIVRATWKLLEGFWPGLARGDSASPPATGKTAAQPPASASSGPPHPDFFEFEYKSPRTLFGLPLLHIANGRDPVTSRLRVAHGIVAIGGIARGVFALGGVAVGAFAFGGLSLGLVSYGGVAVGLLSMGGLGLGLLACFAGLAIAPIALGGLAVGWYAFGGVGFGRFVASATRQDPPARDFFETWAQSLVIHSAWWNILLLAGCMLVCCGLPWFVRRRLRRTSAGLAPAAPSLFAPWLGFVLLYLVHALLLALTADDLPARVASHFNGDGRADGWMPRNDHLLFSAVFPLALGLFLALIARALRVLPASLINLPHRDHWLAPENKAATLTLLGRWMAAPACLLVVFFAQLGLLIVVANLSTPPRLPGGPMIGITIGFLAALMLWLVGLLLRFAEPKAPPAKLRRQHRTLFAAALLALALPAAPLIDEWHDLPGKLRRRHADPEPVPEAAVTPPLAPDFAARLPGGGYLELVGVAPQPSAPDAWWGPDGAPLRPVDWLASYPAAWPVANTQGPAHADGRQFVFHADGPGQPPRILDIRFFDAQGTPAAFAARLVVKQADGRDDERWSGHLMPVHSGETAARIRVLVADGALQKLPDAEIKSRGPGHSFHARIGDRGFLIGEIGERDGQASVPLSAELGGQIEWRLLARDSNQRWHTPRIAEGRSLGDLLQETLVFDGLRPADIVELTLWTRPAHWVEFADIPLASGRARTPAIRVESAPPAPDPDTPESAKIVSLEVLADGRIILGGEFLAEGELSSKLDAQTVRLPKPRIRLQTAPAASLDVVNAVLEACRRAGLSVLEIWPVSPLDEFHQMESDPAVLRFQLAEAEAELTLVTAQVQAGLATQADQLDAAARRDLIAARLADDHPAFLRIQLTTASRRLELAEARLTAGLGTSAERNSAKAVSQIAAARLQKITAKTPGAIPASTAQPPASATVHMRLLDLTLELASVRLRYGPKHPTLIALKTEFAALEKQMPAWRDAIPQGLVAEKRLLLTAEREKLSARYLPKHPAMIENQQMLDALNAFSAPSGHPGSEMAPTPSSLPPTLTPPTSVSPAMPPTPLQAEVNFHELPADFAFDPATFDPAAAALAPGASLRTPPRVTVLSGSECEVSASPNPDAPAPAAHPRVPAGVTMRLLPILSWSSVPFDAHYTVSFAARFTLSIPDPARPALVASRELVVKRDAALLDTPLILDLGLDDRSRRTVAVLRFTLPPPPDPVPPVVSTEVAFIALPDAAPFDPLAADAATRVSAPAAEKLDGVGMIGSSGDEMNLRSSLGVRENAPGSDLGQTPPGVHAVMRPILDGRRVRFSARLTITRPSPDSPQRTLSREVTAEGETTLGTPAFLDLGPDDAARRLVARLDFSAGDNDTVMRYPPRGTPMPDIELLRVADGGPVRLRDFVGQPIVLLFWHSLASPSHEPLAILQGLLAQHPEWRDRVRLITLSRDATREAAAAFLARNDRGGTLDLLVGPDTWKTEPARVFQARNTPTCYLIDAEGRLVRAGSPGELDLGDLLPKLLTAPPPPAITSAPTPTP